MISVKTAAWLCLILVPAEASAEALQPRKISPAEAEGPIFSSPNAAVEMHGADRTVNVEMLTSGDKKVIAGIYQAGPSTFEADPYPVDEFMYFLSGSVQLTSEDGTVTNIGPGDAVTIPKGWKGTWSTIGYSKYYVVYVPEPPNAE